MNILHPTWKTMIMLQINNIKNQKFDEIVHLLMRPMYQGGQGGVFSKSVKVFFE